MSSPGGMVHIDHKPVVSRSAHARGTLMLQPATAKAVADGTVGKGSVVETARAAALLAVKRTSDLIPMTHPLPITGVDIDFTVGQDRLDVDVVVRTDYRTGVEMEALTGVSVALLTAWDLVKPLEKDERGQYPTARITDVHVVRKEKGE